MLRFYIVYMFCLTLLHHINRLNAAQSDQEPFSLLSVSLVAIGFVARMRRLVWIHAGRKRTMLVLSWRGSIVILFSRYHIRHEVTSTVSGWCCICSCTLHNPGIPSSKPTRRISNQE
jgi:hypothetical protein